MYNLSFLPIELKKIFLITILILPLELLAAPSDHGRIHHDNSPWSVTIGIIILLFLLIGWIVSKIPSKHDKTCSNNCVQSNKTPQTILKYIHCPECQGLGYRFKIIKSQNYPMDYIKCDCCKGYKHKLTDEAEKLLIDYYREFNKEEAIESNRLNEENRKKRAQEKEEKLQQYIIEQEIRKEGRPVYTLKEYNNKITESYNTRHILTTKFRELKPTLSMCDCHGNNKQCSNCYGTGYKFNDELHSLMDIYQSSIKERQILTSDRNRIYGEPKLSVNKFENTFISNQLSFTHKRSTQISKQIASIVESMPICQACMGTGRLKIIDIDWPDYPINNCYTVKVKTTCLRCGGCGSIWIKSSN